VKTIWLVSACYNEAGNITELYERIKKIFQTLTKYNFVLLFIDNSSTDGTQEEIENICRNDERVKAIFNSRNYGHIRSPFHGFLQAGGDAVITVLSDLQVDPEIIAEYIKKWEEGYDVVIGVKENEVEFLGMKLLRILFYKVVNLLSEIPLRKNFIGLGLYDKKVVDAIKLIKDPYPYFRGLVFEVGFKRAEVPYYYHGRKRGITSNNFLTLYDLAILGIVSHSKIPLRVATIAGFVASLFFFFVGVFYLVYKLIYWNSFRIGIAPIMIGVFFIASIQLMFLGILGEYIGFIFTKVQNRPLVTEAKRLNF
jgi:glycosyltransferase involved in cell wall biosynthesis